MCLIENESILTDSQQIKIAQHQLTLAKLSELIQLSVKIHSICDSCTSAVRESSSRNCHNKLVTIIGDLLHAKIVAELQALQQPDIVWMYSKILQNEIEDHFNDSTTYSDVNFLMEKSSQSFATSLGYSFKSAMLLSDLSNEIKFESAKNAAFKFGFYLALHLKVRQWAKSGDFSNISVLYQENAIANLNKLPLKMEAKKCLERLFLWCKNWCW